MGKWFGLVRKNIRINKRSWAKNEKAKGRGCGVVGTLALEVSTK